jgi:hypothetical protein
VRSPIRLVLSLSCCVKFSIIVVVLCV